LPKKINASSNHNPVLFCNAVQSLEASSLRALLTHATASTTKEEEEKQEEGVLAGEPALYPSAR
jgi:hypothetical protein